MNSTAVFRLISLIPDRAARLQSGSVYSPSEAAACKYPDRLSYLGRFLHWLGPLDPMTREDQQILGVRTSGGRPVAGGEELGEEALDEMELDDADELPLLEEPLNRAQAGTQAGTQIAAALPPSTVGG